MYTCNHLCPKTLTLALETPQKNLQEKKANLREKQQRGDSSPGMDRIHQI